MVTPLDRRLRTGAVYVQDESTGEVVYEGPDATLDPELVDRLAAALNTERGEPMVDAAMAHLNLLMIHPFGDGNGRMARSAASSGSRPFGTDQPSDGVCHGDGWEAVMGFGRVAVAVVAVAGVVVAVAGCGSQAGEAPASAPSACGAACAAG